jgi:hypothetical protein
MATIPENRKMHAERRCAERMPYSEAVSIQVMHTGQGMNAFGVAIAFPPAFIRPGAYRWGWLIS